jgi:hypothetical protein
MKAAGGEQEHSMTSLNVVSGCVIAAGGALSNAVDCTGSNRIVRIITPDSWTGNASLSFMLSDDGGNTFRDLYRVVTPGVAYNTFEVVVPRPPVGASITVPIGLGSGVQQLKVRSGTALLPVVQEQDREFSFVVEVPDPAPAGLRRAIGWAGKHGAVRLAQRGEATVALWRGAGAIEPSTRLVSNVSRIV